MKIPVKHIIASPNKAYLLLPVENHPRPIMECVGFCLPTVKDRGVTRVLKILDRQCFEIENNSKAILVNTRKN